MYTLNKEIIQIKTVMNSDKNNHDIYSQLSRHSMAMWSSTGLVPVSPAKVKAGKSIIFDQKTPTLCFRVKY